MLRHAGARVGLCALLLSTSLGFEPSAASRAAAPAASPVGVGRLRTDGKENPLGLGNRTPRFSWQLTSEARGTRQAAWQLRVARSEADLARTGRLVWDSGRVASDASILRPYGGPPLESRRRYAWQVQVWDQGGRASGWSAPATFEMGLLAPADWTASWIEPDLNEQGDSPVHAREAGAQRARIRDGARVVRAAAERPARR